MTKLPTVALIGRTNVGKSTLFNKLSERKGAIVSDIAGTTRDYKVGECLWLGQSFLLIDTAGLDVVSEKEIDIKAVKKAKEIAQKADLIIFLVDVKDGVLPQDKEYTKMIKALKKPYILAVNKVDSMKDVNAANEFSQLGLGNPMKISAATGADTGDLLDNILFQLKGKTKAVVRKKIIPDIKVAIVGKPNVGKSSLINKICGEERVIVSEIAHTTRDSQEINLEIENNDKKYNVKFIDTAGLRKQGKIVEKIEKASAHQTLENIKRADIVLFVIDAKEEITAQDKNISRVILENNKSIIFIVNKWDLVEDKTTKSDQVFTEFVYSSFPYLTWAPIVFVSAKTGVKIKRIIKMIFEINEKQHLEISDKLLEKVLKKIIKRQSPRKTKGIKPPYLHTLKQIKTNPQTFELTADQPENIHFSYMRFIINQLREKFKFDGVGVKIVTDFPERNIGDKKKRNPNTSFN